MLATLDWKALVFVVYIAASFAIRMPIYSNWISPTLANILGILLGLASVYAAADIAVSQLGWAIPAATAFALLVLYDFVSAVQSKPTPCLILIIKTILAGVLVVLMA